MPRWSVARDPRHFLIMENKELIVARFLLPKKLAMAFSERCQNQESMDLIITTAIFHFLEESARKESIGKAKRNAETTARRTIPKPRPIIKAKAVVQ